MMLSPRFMKSALANRPLALTVLAAALAATGAGAIETYDPNPEPNDVVIAAAQASRALLSSDSDSGPESAGSAVRQGRAETKAIRDEEKKEEARRARAHATVDTSVTTSSSAADRAPGVVPDTPRGADVPVPKDPARRTTLKARTSESTTVR